jgi:hypothetical protein
MSKFPGKESEDRQTDGYEFASRESAMRERVSLVFRVRCPGFRDTQQHSGGMHLVPCGCFIVSASGVAVFGVSRSGMTGTVMPSCMYVNHCHRSVRLAGPLWNKPLSYPVVLDFEKDVKVVSLEGIFVVSRLSKLHKNGDVTAWK